MVKISITVGNTLEFIAIAIACQKIIKKAVVESLKEDYGISWFEETGPVHQIQFSIMKNEVTIMLDTTGRGLHKRGYRPEANDAPIRETLAAALFAWQPAFSTKERNADHRRLS